VTTDGSAAPLPATDALQKPAATAGGGGACTGPTPASRDAKKNGSPLVRRYGEYHPNGRQPTPRLYSFLLSTRICFVRSRLGEEGKTWDFHAVDF
jgi:hypothetical protein